MAQRDNLAVCAIMECSRFGTRHTESRRLSSSTVPPSTGSIPATTTRQPRIGLVLLALMLAAFVAILNETVLSVALPQLMVDFSISAGVAQWFTTGFLLTMAIVIPTTGFLMGRFSRRTLFVAALIAFLIGTALAATAGTFLVMLIARVIQALGTAVIMPLLMGTTMMLVAPEKRGLMMGLNAVVISVGPAIGPTLAGIVMNSLSWRFVFIFMIPVAVIILIFGAIVLRLPQQRADVRLDVVSVILSAVGFGGIVYALASASEVLAGNIAVIAAGLIGIASLVLFVRRQIAGQKTDSALLDLRPFRSGSFRAAVALIAIAFAVMLGTVLILPIYFQDGMGLPVLQTGMLLLGGGLAQAIAAPLFGRLFDVVGPRPIVIPAAFLMLAGLIALATIGASTPLALIVTFYVAVNVGIAGILSTMMTSAMASVEPRFIGHGSAIVNTLQQLGGAIGTAAMAAALTIGGASAASASGAVLSGSTAAFVLGAVLAVAAVVISFFVRPLTGQHPDAGVTAGH